MPRTVNVSDRNDRRDKKKSDASGEAGLFGIRRMWAPTATHILDDYPRDEAAPGTDTASYGADSDPLVEQALSPETDPPASPELCLLAEQVLAKAVPGKIVGPDGGVDFDTLFQAARLPAVAVNADHAVHVLESIPADLPKSVKQLLVKTSLSVMTNLFQEGSVSADIVGDAAQKMLWVARLQENITAERDAERARAHSEIARLHAEIARRNERLAEADARADAAIQSCRHRADQLHNVTLFFGQQDSDSDNHSGGGGGSAQSEPSPGGEEEHIPAYLREDSVLRLLGLPDAPDEPASGRPFLTSPESRNGVLSHA